MNIVLTPASLREVVEAYSKVDAFAFDVETMDTSPKPEGFEDMSKKEREQYDHRGDPRRNRVVWIGLATYGRVDIIPMGHPNGDLLRVERPLLATGRKRQAKGLPLRDADYSRDEKKFIKVFGPPPEQLTPGEVFAALKHIFAGPALKIGHNVAFDLQSIVKYIGFLPAAPYFCTMTTAFVLDSRNKWALNLKDTAYRELGAKVEKGVGVRIEKYTFDEVAKYLYGDAKNAWLLYRVMRGKIPQCKADKAFNLDMDVLEVTCKMEMAGALVDTEALANLRDILDVDLEVAKGDIFRLAGRAFNLNSNAEKQRLLFAPKAEGGRGLRPKILTDGGIKKQRDRLPITIYDYSTSADALKWFQGKDELATALLKYADLNKLMSTYVIPYLGGEVTHTTGGKEKTTSRVSLLLNGRVHTRFSLVSADTGRFSSKNPNLQNIPNPRTTRGKAVRNVFIAPNGYRLIVADYSQVEPRIIASFSGDERMISAYLNGEDIYTAIADPLGITRAGGKVLILSVSYGVGPDKVATTLGIPVKKAESLINDFYDEFHTVTTYKKQVIRNARAQRPEPFVTTLVGRRRYLPDLISSTNRFKFRAERQCFNTKIQGSGADIIKMAMVRADRLIPEGAYLSLTVHDEIVTVAPNHLVDETAEAIREAMEGINILKVPLIADVKVVDKWGEAK